MKDDRARRNNGAHAAFNVKINKRNLSYDVVLFVQRISLNKDSTVLENY